MTQEGKDGLLEHEQVIADSLFAVLCRTREALQMQSWLQAQQLFYVQCTLETAMSGRTPNWIMNGSTDVRYMSGPCTQQLALNPFQQAMRVLKLSTRLGYCNH